MAKKKHKKKARGKMFGRKTTKFKIGDRVNFSGCSEDEIIEEIRRDGFLRGRYTSGYLSCAYGDPKQYTLVDEKAEKIEALERKMDELKEEIRGLK